MSKKEIYVGVGKVLGDILRSSQITGMFGIWGYNVINGKVRLYR